MSEAGPWSLGSVGICLGTGKLMTQFDARRGLVRVCAPERLLGLLGLVVASPVVAMGAVAIRLSSPGPVTYRATRVGAGGETFTMLKLRTMHAGADRSGGITGGADPRIFPAGAVIRRLKIDELPQLLNVARGEMCFVGPRPEAPEIVKEHYQPWMWETLSVPPGIVGPGSLNYFLDEGELPADPSDAESVYVQKILPRKLARDLVFVRRRSLRYQLELVLRTLAGIVGLRRIVECWRRREDEEAQAILEQARSNA